MILFTKTDKARIITLLENCVKEFIYPGVSVPSSRQVASHIDWMRQQSPDLHITCRLETFPESESTVITIAASFKRPLDD